jgi:hypothetical protein
MASKFAAKGAQVKVAATATPTNVLDGVKEVSVNGGTREMIDTTNHASTGTKQSIPNPLRDVRSLDVTIFYDPADTQHERIRAAHEAGTLEYQTFVFPDTGAAQYAMSGYITDWTVPTLGVDGALEVTYTFTANTAEVFTQ